MGTNSPRKCLTQRTQRTPTHRRSPFVVLSKVAPRFSPRQVLRQNPTGTQRTQRGREVAEVFLGIGHSSHPARLLPPSTLSLSPAPSAHVNAPARPAGLKRMQAGGLRSQARILGDRQTDV